jgi:HlyD family secretion protein
MVAIAAVVGLIGFAVWRATHLGDGDLVYTTTIESKEVASYVFTSGKVVAKEDRSVYAQSPGVLKSVDVALGQEVKAGDVLAVFESDTIDQQIAASRTQLSIAQENLNQIRNSGKINFDLALKTAVRAYEDAVKSYQDQLALFNAGAISQSELDLARRQMERAETEKLSTERNYNNYGKESTIRIQALSVTAARQTLNQLIDQKEKLIVKAPVAGIVYAVNVKAGQIATQAQPMFAISSTGELKVTASISEYDISQLKLGQSVVIKSDGFDEAYAGEVSYISDVARNLASAQAVETVVDIEVTFKTTDTRFKPNYSANLEILTAKKASALTVPYEAIYTDKDGVKKIFAVVAGAAVEKIVQLGIEGDLEVEVMNGSIAEGDIIILDPTETLKDGDPVQTVEVK